MFNQERHLGYAPGPERAENWGQDVPSALPGGSASRPGWRWTRGKLLSAAIVAGLLLAGIACISETIAIQQRQYDIQGKIGNVWNEVDRAAQLLQQDAALLNATIAAQNDALTKIAQARSSVASIKAGQGTTDPNAALSAAIQMSGGIRAFVENYPDYGVGSNTHAVLVQIEGSFNRIEYARGQLIEEQTAFNK
ncbi:MAG TPA: LemA family protein, partial [Ktedonobacteraceae bacterium]